MKRLHAYERRNLRMPNEALMKSNPSSPARGSGLPVFGNCAGAGAGALAGAGLGAGLAAGLAGARAG